MWKRSSKSKFSICSAIALISSLCMVASGLFCLWKFPSMFKDILNKEFTITKGSAAYKAWKTPSIPTKIRFFLFSVENPRQVVYGGKPHLKEVGPFVYREEIERIEDVFHEDGTVSFKTRKVWFPIEEESISLDTPVTSLDVPQFAAAESVRGKWGEYGMMMTLSWRDSLFTTRTARKWLFEGFKDPLMTAGAMFAPKTDMPMDKFGWFYGRNGSTWSDGIIRMNTGAADYDTLGDIVSWKGTNRTRYPGPCGDIKGSATGFLPVDLNRQYIDYFSPDICRDIRFDKTSTWIHNGLPVTRFAVNATSTFGNASTNPENVCFNANLPAGVHNSTGCKDEGILPVFVSLPHFLDADPVYLDQFTAGSMNPDPEKHSAAMIMQDDTSIPIEIQMRLQIIMHIRRNVNMGKNFNQLRDTFLPLMWFDAVASTTPDIESQVWMLVHMVDIVSKVGISMLVVGFLVALAVVFFVSRRIINNRRMRTEKPPAERANPEELEPL